MPGRLLVPDAARKVRGAVDRVEDDGPVPHRRPDELTPVGGERSEKRVEPFEVERDARTYARRHRGNLRPTGGSWRGGRAQCHGARSSADGMKATRDTRGSCYDDLAHAFRRLRAPMTSSRISCVPASCRSARRCRRDCPSSRSSHSPAICAATRRAPCSEAIASRTRSSSPMKSRSRTATSSTSRLASSARTRAAKQLPGGGYVPCVTTSHALRPTAP